MRMSMTATGLALALACGGGGGGGPVGGGNVPNVAGTYQATFTAVTATGCQGLVEAGSSTTGGLVVTQSGAAVTLRISDLRPEFGSNPVGSLSSSGAFQFGPGAIVIDPDPATPGDEFSANGTFDGTFSGGAMNIAFDFTAFTCMVTGTIVGQR